MMYDDARCPHLARYGGVPSYLLDETQDVLGKTGSGRGGDRLEGDI